MPSAIVQNFLHPGLCCRRVSSQLVTFISYKEMLLLALHTEIFLWFPGKPGWRFPLDFQGRLLFGYWHQLFLTFCQFGLFGTKDLVVLLSFVCLFVMAMVLAVLCAVSENNYPDGCFTLPDLDSDTDSDLEGIPNGYNCTMSNVLLDRFRFGFPSQVQISVPKMGTVAILEADVCPPGGIASPSPVM